MGNCIQIDLVLVHWIVDEELRRRIQLFRNANPLRLRCARSSDENNRVTVVRETFVCGGLHDCEYNIDRVTLHAGINYGFSHGRKGNIHRKHVHLSQTKKAATPRLNLFKL